jgi:hypothetical protein
MTIDGSYVSGEALADLLSYGVVYNQDGDSYGRTGRLSAMPIGKSLGDELLPIQAQMRRCVLSDAGVVQYYLDPDNSYNRDGVAPSVTGTDDAGTANKVSDTGLFTGDAADYVGRYVHNTTDDTYAMITAKDSDDVLSLDADIMDVGDEFEICTAVLNGDDGQVMVEIPKFYFRYTISYYGISAVHRWEISDVPLDGFTVFPAFVKAGVEVPYRYYGAYEGSMYDASESAMCAVASIASNIYQAGDKLCSVSGQYPKVNETRAEFRAMAEARGAGWHQEDFYLRSAVQLLYLIEYADFDSQAMIGNGRVSLSNGDWVPSEIFDETNYGYIGKCGLSNGDGNATAANNDATNLTTGESPAYMTYRGIENLWGNVWQFVDGINIRNFDPLGGSAYASYAYATNNYEDFADDTDTGYNLLTAGLAQADGYARQICPIEDGFLPASVADGASNTGLADYYYTCFNDDPNVGWRVALWGGNASNGPNAGAFCALSLYGSSSASAPFGGRLCF